MKILVALDKNSVKEGIATGTPYIDGTNIEEFYFDEETASALEKDGFLSEMWENFDALFDWGDCDYFNARKCTDLKLWLETRIQQDTDQKVASVYSVLLDYCNKAIKAETGIYFDF